MAGTRKWAGILGAILALASLVLFVFRPSETVQFLVWGDSEYVTQNTTVLQGLTLEGLRWAFTEYYASNWHPLTWISHMLDVELFGLNPLAHRWMNLLFHLGNTLLLFGGLWALTGKTGRSFVVAALFGIHPLHVESAAWIMERKDVLSTFFGLLAIGSYCRFVKKPGFGSYSLALLLYLASLMAKPMLVTLPLLLFVLDLWPLERRRALPGGSGETERIPASYRAMILEKIPFAILAALTSGIAFFTQYQGQAVISLEKIPLAWRLENFFVAYGWYLLKMCVPLNLSYFYPYRVYHFFHLYPIGAAVFLAVVTGFVVRHRARGYLPAGWAWYLVTLLPVIGLVQIGEQPYADRYSYLPLAGPFVMAVWLLADEAARRKYGRALQAALSFLILLVLIFPARNQVGFWENSYTLFRHAVEATPDNSVARYNYAKILEVRGETSEAIRQYRETIRVRPDYLEAYNNLGLLLSKEGEVSEAITVFEAALAIKPDAFMHRLNLGHILLATGRFEEAVPHYRHAVRINPSSADAHHALGSALFNRGDAPESLIHLREAIRQKPDAVLFHLDLGAALFQLGRYAPAFEAFQEALRYDPANREALESLSKKHLFINNEVKHSQD